MTYEEQSLLIVLATEKLEIATAALQQFVATGSPEGYRRLAGIELEVRHAMAAVRELGKVRGLCTGYPSITCPTCTFTSYNPHDVANKYCGRCHRFHDDPAAESTRP